MAKILGKDPYSYQQEYASFLQDVKRFHNLRCSSFHSIPRIGGKEVDLYLLYTKVTTLGGWVKVNDGQRWEEILQLFNIPKNCTNASQALKQIYLRYLDAYEKLHFLGVDPNQRSEFEDDERPSRKKSVSTFLTVPMYYNHRQHHVADNVRTANGMSTAFAAVTAYDKLEKSLLSGLPNEVDFAVNVCTLLSNEGKHTMKLTRSNKLVDLLMAHIGIFAEARKLLPDDDVASTATNAAVRSSSIGPGSMIDFYHQWKKTMNRDFLRFWLDAVENKEILELLSPSGAFKIRDHVKPVIGEELFNLQRSSGIKDIEGQRVLQMASIIRNLSFEEENTSVLAAHHLVFRFLLLCAHCKYSNLRQMGLDTLGNVASQMVLDPMDCWTTQLILQTICRCLASRDKFSVIRGMEILSKLCQVEANEDVIAENLELKVYEDIVSMLTILDIQLIVHTLEVLYQLSELGEMTTTQISMAESSVDLLVSLVTVEAQSYGQNALVGIKVVEHAPSPAEAAAVANVSYNRPLPNTMRPRPMRGPVQSVQFMPQRQVVSTRPTLPSLQQNQDTESEQFACNWLRAHLESSPIYSIPRVDLYNSYLAACNYHNVSGVISTTDFTRCVRLVFSNSECIKVDKPNGMAEMHFKGIRRRPVPLSFPPPSGIGSMVRSTNQALPCRPTVAASPQMMTPPMSPSAPRYPSPLPASPQRPSSTASNDSRSSIIHLQLQTPPKLPSPLETSPLRPSPTGSPINQTGQQLQQQRDSNLVRTLLASKVTQNLQLARLQQSASPPSSTSSTTMHPAAFQNTPHTAGPMQYPAGQASTQHNKMPPQGTAPRPSMSPNALSSSAFGVTNPYPPYASSQGQSPPEKSSNNNNNVNRKRRNSSPTGSTGSNTSKSSRSKIVRTKSPSPIRSPSQCPLSPRACQLEVCGDVERAQDIVKNDNCVHEAIIERVENQCSPRFSGPNPVRVDSAASRKDNDANESDETSDSQSERVDEKNVHTAANQCTNQSENFDEAEKTVSVIHQSNEPVEQGKADIITKEILTNKESRQPEYPVNGDAKKPVLESQSCAIRKTALGVSSAKKLESDLLSKLDEKDRALENVLEKVSPKSEKRVIVNGLNHMENGDCRHHITAEEKILPCSKIDHQKLLIKQNYLNEIPEDNCNSKVIVRTNGPIVANGYLSGSDSDEVDGGLPDSNGVDDDRKPADLDKNHSNLPQDASCVNSNADNDFISETKRVSSDKGVNDTTDNNGAIQGVPDAAAANVNKETCSLRSDECANINGESLLDSCSEDYMEIDEIVEEAAEGAQCYDNPGAASAADASTTKQSTITTTTSPSNEENSTGTSALSSSADVDPTRVIQSSDVASSCASSECASDSVSDSNPPSSSVSDNIQLTNSVNIPLTSVINNLDQIEPDGVAGKKPDKVAPGKGKKSTKIVRSRENSIESRRSSTQSVSSSAGPEYVCEWNGCKKCFESAKQVFLHAFKTHLHIYPGGLCLWESCDKLRRQKYSLITHVQDRHCTEQALKAAALRRQQIHQSGAAPVAQTSPAPPMPPPVYPPDAALQAIKRFTAKPPFQEFVDTKEGPVTKHIRLTSSLILRNLARFSAHGRSLIKRHEHHLTLVALSGVESSTAISNCLWELHQHH
ncbi:uncharacterized protein LOC141910865 [Tubulanus polymorphus]|uniref:uncharacterized protein LOC141910865 n=1 Tax=Tubulanus polymorphus TaxID=672921 RepID=UPI003DA296DD